MRLGEHLEQEAFDSGIRVHTMQLDGVDALYVKLDGQPFIIKCPTDTQAQLACLLAEELGHYATAPDLRLTYRSISDRKAEARARRWAHRRLIPPERILEALRAGLRELYEIAEYLDVTEAFLGEAIEDYCANGWEAKI